MREKINEALKQAVKAQDRRRRSTLRLINAAIQDRDIASRSNGKDGVSDTEIVGILSQMIRQRRQSITAYEEGARIDLAQQEKEEIDIIETFLPPKLNDAATEQAIDKAIEELGGEGLRDLGRVMGALKERYTGQMDFSKASSLVRHKLNAG